MKNKPLSISIIDLDEINNPLLAGGQATATYEVGKRLAEKGHKITVYCSKYPGYKDTVKSGIYYKHIGINTNNIKINNAFYILTIPFVVRKIKNEDVILECFTAPISTLFSPLFTSIPVIAIPSMFNAKAFSKKYFFPFFWIENIGLKFYKFMLPYSKIDEQKAKKCNSNILTKIITQGVSDEFFQIEKQEPEYILFLGRFDIEQKGIDLLLKAYAMIQDRINYKLLLVGHGPDKKLLMQLISKLKLTDKVTLTGPAYGKKKLELMSKALFTAFPSKHDEISLWALESMAAGLPLVCFDLPESYWLTDKESLKAPCFDIKYYSELLLEACNRKKIKRYSINAQQLAKKYSWENVVANMEDFIRYVIETTKYNENK